MMNNQHRRRRKRGNPKIPNGDFKALKKGTVELLILQALSIGDMYGTMIAEIIYEASDSIFVIPEGSCYPTLYRLEEQDCLASYRYRPNFKRREVVYYSITEKGRERLQRQLHIYNLFTDSIQKALLVIQRANYNDIVDRFDFQNAEEPK